MRRLVASRRPYVRSRRFCVHVAVELTEGDGISAISVTLELSHGIFRLPCRLPWQLRYLTAAKACEGDKIRALFVTLEPFRAIFRLPCIPSRHLRRRAATKQPEGDASGAHSVALTCSHGSSRQSARIHARRMMQNQNRNHQLVCGLAIIPTCVPLAQLDRASASGAEGRGFESHRGHHFSKMQSTKRAIS